MAAGDLEIEIVAFGDLAEHDQFVGGDLTAGDAGDDRVGPTSLDVGEEAIVGILDGLVFALRRPGQL